MIRRDRAVTRAHSSALRGALVIALAGMVVACGQAVITDLEPSAQPRSFDSVEFASAPREITGPTTAVLRTLAIDPVVTNPAQELPVTVLSDDAGGALAVTVTDTSRVVALDIAGSLTATIWGLGFEDTLVGKDISTTFPGTEDIPVVTAHSHTVNVETILALQPTLVITDGSIGPRRALQQLRDAGVPVVFIDTDATFAGAQEMARRVGEAYGAPDAGEELAQHIGAQVDDAMARVASVAPLDSAEQISAMFIYARGSAGIYYVFGEESGADQLFDALGVIDAAGEAGIRGMRPLTDEALVAANPDVILMMTNGLESTGGVEGLLEARPAVALTTAGKNRRIVDMADGDILAFGPRSALVIEALAIALYALPAADAVG